MSSKKDPKLLSLIQAVRRNTPLYDFRHAKYRDMDFINRVWEGIVVECDFKNVVCVKDAWNDLSKFFMICFRNKLIQLARANYNEKHISLPQEERTDAISSWNYYSEMRFIAPFRDKSKDPELERLVQLAKSIVLPENQYHQPCNEALSTVTISTIRASAETQTPSENILMDIPAINEENMSEKDKCLRSFFDAMFRATRSLPLKLQNKVKLEMLQSLNEAETLVVAEKNSTFSKRK